MLPGNGGQDIFFDEPARIRFYKLVEERGNRFDVRIHALCLMGTTVHLVGQMAEISRLRLIGILSFYQVPTRGRAAERTSASRAV